MSNITLVNPVVISDWHLLSNVEFVKNFVPNGMKLFSSIVTFCWEWVTSSITCWIFVVNSADAMKWLMDVSKIVHQKSQCVWHSNFFWCVGTILPHLVFSNCLNIKLSIITFSFIKPVCDSSNGFSNIVGIWFEIVVANIRIIVKIWLINEMPARLPASSMIFDIVSKCDALSKSVLIFSDWESIVLKNR